jgi:alpha-tubulin suppressor-like RCC1 family protein
MDWKRRSDGFLALLCLASVSACGDKPTGPGNDGGDTYTGNFSAVSTGFISTCGIATTGDSYCWGPKATVHFTNGAPTPDQLNTLPTRLAGGLRFSSIASGGTFACGLTTGGVAYCWGYNSEGELGDGSTIDRANPVAVSTTLTFSSLTGGNTHTCGLTGAGAAYCWGINSTGELGDGTTTSRLTPTAVTGGLIFSAIQAGGGANDHTCGLTSGGAVYCWGANAQGQIGDGTTTNRVAPTPVTGGHVFTSLTSGGSNNCGLVSGGTAFCWGANAKGQLGDGTTTNRSAPVAVSGGLVFSFIDTGASSDDTCGITTAGAAFCWGDNLSGALGDNTTVAQRSAPSAVAGGFSFTTLSVGGFHSCGVATTGLTYCWGYNHFGQLGDGTTTDRSTPVHVGG